MLVSFGVPLSHSPQPNALPRLQLVLRQVVGVPPIHVQLASLRQVQRHQVQSLHIRNRPRGAQHLGDELLVGADQVQLQAVKVDPLAGDVTPVGQAWGQAAARGADVLTNREGEGVEDVVLGGGEMLPQGLAQGEQVGYPVGQAVQAAAEPTSGRNKTEQGVFFAVGQGMFVLAGEEEGGQYPDGEDDAGGGLALGVVLVSDQPGGLS